MQACFVYNVGSNYRKLCAVAKAMILSDRSFLQELRDTATGMCVGNLKPDWIRAYQALADAADRLDAMQARALAPSENSQKRTAS
jgi:hypothetical protein